MPQSAQTAPQAKSAKTAKRANKSTAAAQTKPSDSKKSKNGGAGASSGSPAKRSSSPAKKTAAKAHPSKAQPTKAAATKAKAAKQHRTMQQGAPSAQSKMSAQAKAAGKTKAAPRKPAHAAPKPAPSPRTLIEAGVRRWRIGAAVLAALLVLYVVGSLVFSVCFLPGTTINGDSASFQTVSAMQRRMSNAADSYGIQLVAESPITTITAEEVDLVFDPDAYGDAARSLLSGWSWPQTLFASHDYRLQEGVSFDADKLSHVVGDAIVSFNQSQVQPQNARIAYDADTGVFVGIPETQGTTLDAGIVNEQVAFAVSGLQNSVRLTNAELKPALSVKSPRFEEARARADQIAGSGVNLTIAGDTVYRVEPSLLGSWLYLGGDYEIYADQEKIANWARSELSALVDTVGSTRTYTRPDDGKYIEISGGTYGWNVDSSLFGSQLCDQLEAGSTADMAIPMLDSAAIYTHDDPDWGLRYIDVDLTDQYVRMFDDNVLVWQSVCVTGDSASEFGTVIGVYSILRKQKDATLVGLDYDEDGEPDYESEVAYWMPFYEGYGFHDASWRDNFDSNAYLENGSHGCVNLPVDAASSLFELVRVGDAVIVHW